MKVFPFHIPKPLHENLIVQEDSSQQFYGRLHKHVEVQISLILKGQGKLIICDSVHQFSDGDFFVIGPNCPHFFNNDPRKGSAHMISLFFTENTFGASFFENADVAELRPFFETIDRGFSVKEKNTLIKDLMLNILNSGKLDRFIYFLQLLRQLSTIEKRPLTQFIYPKEISRTHGNRMQTIYDYAIKNFNNEIDLDTVSRLVFMTPNAFCRFFKRHTNKTFFQFLTELRIEHACQLLVSRNRDQSIYEVSESAGFSSISHFNRKFKKLKGVTPTRYRSKN